MERRKLFDLESRSYCRSKNLTVRVPPERRQKLELIASERHWVMSKMINRMIENFIEEYDSEFPKQHAPKPRQGKFDFAS